jgi:hypothetical protein
MVTKKEEQMKTNRRILHVLLPIVVLAFILPFFASCVPSDPCANPRVQTCIELAKNQGYQDGYTKGKEDGYNDGKIAGDAAGYSRGLADGKNQCPTCPTCPQCPQYQQPYYPYNPYWYY